MVSTVTSNSSLQSSPSPACLIRFRLSDIDTVQLDVPSLYDVRCSPFFDEPLRVVPEVRIYGATDRGQRVVAHVHGVLPYLYIEYQGELDPESGKAFPLSG